MIGGGIRTRHPEPAPGGLTVDPEEWPRHSPTGGPLKLAALIERYERFANSYVAVAERDKARGNLRNSIMPEAYLPGPLDDALGELVRVTYGDNGGRALNVCPQPQPSGDPAGHGTHIVDVTPQWSDTETFERLAFAPDSGYEFLRLADGGLQRTAQWSGVVEFAYDNPDNGDNFLVHQSFSRSLRGTYNYGGLPLGLYRGIIDLLIWGHTPYPSAPVLDATSGIVRPDPAYGEAWLAWMEVMCGRVAWQMAMVAAMLQEDDLCRLQTGGRGGGGTGEDAVPGPRVYDPPLPPTVTPDGPPRTSPWADALGPLIVDTVITLLLAL